MPRRSSPSGRPRSLRRPRHCSAALEPLSPRIRQTTGLSAGAAANALRALVEFDLLEESASRGRNAARRVRDPDRLLAKYADFAVNPAVSLTVGVAWRDFLEKLCEIGSRWDRAEIEWAATGAVAASVLAPCLTTVQLE